MTKRKRTSEIQVGDAIVFLGTEHRVASLDERNGFGWPIARAADGWGISLQPDGWVEVAA